MASLVLLGLFATICWEYHRRGTADSGLCVLTAGAFGTFLAFPTNAQNTKNKTSDQTD